MDTQHIVEPVSYFSAFSLHDVRIENIHIDVSAQKLKLMLEDLNRNYERSSGYVVRPCTIVFNGVVEYFVDVLDLEGLRIDNFFAHVIDKLVQVEIDLNLGGGNASWGSARSSISIKFVSMEIKDRESGEG